jgi:hypothetical protein
MTDVRINLRKSVQNYDEKNIMEHMKPAISSITKKVEIAKEKFANVNYFLPFYRQFSLTFG